MCFLIYKFVLEHVSIDQDWPWLIKTDDIAWSGIIIKYFKMKAFSMNWINENVLIYQDSWNRGRACGAMDNASDYGSEDSRFDSW